jgi:beta-N-acetylhexosaminidase
MPRRSIVFTASLALAVSALVVSPGRNSGQISGATTQAPAPGRSSLQYASQAAQVDAARDLREQLGQNFVVGIPSPIFDAQTESFLSYIKPGGVVLYHRNVKSREQLRALIADLQSFALRTTGHPYFVMIDEEPGAVTRLGLFQNVRASATPDWHSIERDISVLESEGINVELAPLADFPFSRESFLRKRVPADSIPALMRFNRRFIALLRKHGISATVKHFPGMGIFVTDPHKQLPVGNINSRQLDSSLGIFEDGIKSGADLVMTAHAVYGDIDPANPATVSHKIITEVLRNRLHFRGLVITDDLSQMALAKSDTMTVEDATIAASKAGSTLLMFSHNFPRTRRIFDTVLERAEQDKELQSMVTQNYRTIVEFKRKALRPVAHPLTAQMPRSSSRQELD